MQSIAFTTRLTYSLRISPNSVTEMPVHYVAIVTDKRDKATVESFGNVIHFLIRFPISCHTSCTPYFTWFESVCVLN